MRAFVRNYIQAEKVRREESGEKGFSLIELIVVVVILGVLAAVAIPIFLGIQTQAEQSSLDAVTANAASQAAAEFATGGTPTAASFSNLETASELDGIGLAIAIGPGETDAAAVLGLENFCVTGSATGLTNATAGPGC